MGKLPENWGKGSAKKVWDKENQPPKKQIFENIVENAANEATKAEVIPEKSQIEEQVQKKQVFENAVAVAAAASEAEKPDIIPEEALAAVITDDDNLGAIDNTKSEEKTERIDTKIENPSSTTTVKNSTTTAKNKKKGKKKINKTIVIVAVITLIIALAAAVYFLFIRGDDSKVEDALTSDIPENGNETTSEESEITETSEPEDSSSATNEEGTSTDESNSDESGSDTADDFNINNYLGEWVCGEKHESLMVDQYGRVSVVVLYDYEFHLYDVIGKTVSFDVYKYAIDPYDNSGYIYSLLERPTASRVSENCVTLEFYSPSGENNNKVIINIEFSNNTVTLSLDGPENEFGFDSNRIVFHRAEDDIIFANGEPENPIPEPNDSIRKFDIFIYLKMALSSYGDAYICDINNDGIPELFTQMSSVGDVVEIYTYENGDVIQLANYTTSREEDLWFSGDDTGLYLNYKIYGQETIFKITLENNEIIFTSVDSAPEGINMSEAKEFNSKVSLYRSIIKEATKDYADYYDGTTLYLYDITGDGYCEIFFDEVPATNGGYKAEIWSYGYDEQIKCIFSADYNSDEILSFVCNDKNIYLCKEQHSTIDTKKITYENGECIATKAPFPENAKIMHGRCYVWF